MGELRGDLMGELGKKKLLEYNQIRTLRQLKLGPRGPSNKVTNSNSDNKCDKSTSSSKSNPETRKSKPLSGWQNPSSKNKGASKSNDNRLSGMKQVRTFDLYVQNIERVEGDKLVDIANKVREHCRGNKIRVTNARVITK